MSDLEKKLTAKKEHLEEKVAGEIVKVKRSFSKRMGLWLAWFFACLVVLAVAVFAVFVWYSRTEDFNRRVGREVVKVLEDATGGRVELRRISFDLLHLAVEADGLIIHGLEGPGEAPYIAVDKVQLRVEIFDFFTRIAGSELASHVRLNYLSVEHPQIHLIVDKDGKTNQPVPKHPSTSDTSV